MATTMIQEKCHELMNALSLGDECFWKLSVAFGETWEVCLPAAGREKQHLWGCHLLFTGAPELASNILLFLPGLPWKGDQN
jgi:hypothetical protein